MAWYLPPGPTGSEKLQVFHALVQEIKSDEINIVTLEDPVEYKMDGINQIQVNPDVGLTFANGLRSILRQDPDVVMVGEIRDKETAAFSSTGCINRSSCIVDTSYQFCSWYSTEIIRYGCRALFNCEYCQDSYRPTTCKAYNHR